MKSPADGVQIGPMGLLAGRQRGTYPGTKWEAYPGMSCMDTCAMPGYDFVFQFLVDSGLVILIIYRMILV